MLGVGISYCAWSGVIVLCLERGYRIVLGVGYRIVLRVGYRIVLRVGISYCAWS